MGMLIEIVVYTTSDYKENERIWVDNTLTDKEIKDKVNQVFPVWYYYDIITNK
jgi:hypothetical protein